MKDKLVTLGKYLNYIDAEVIKTKLESEGIECFVTDLHSNIITGTTYSVEHRLQVHESDLEKAKGVLKQKPIELDENSDIAEGEDPDFPSVQPKKDLIEILAEKRNFKLLIISIIWVILIIYLLIKLN